MKNRFKLFGVIATAAVIALAITGCPIPDGPSAPPLKVGKGTVYINLSGGARTLLPSQFDLSRLYFVLTFTQAGGGGQQTVSQTGQESVVVQLVAGTWNLDIRGYVSQDSASNASAAVVYYTENGIAVSSGANVTVNANLLPNTGSMTQNGTGTVSYDITLPQRATGTLTVLSLDGDLIGQPAALTQTVNSGDRDLASGEYNISVVITHEGIEKTWWALAHIYDSAITRAVVGPDDFTDVLPDNGTITIMLTMDDFTMIDEGYGVFGNVEQPLILFKNGGPGETITLSANGLNVVAWRVGGTVIATGSGITLSAAYLDTGSYTLNLTFTKDGKTWQSNLAFTVVEGLFSLDTLDAIAAYLAAASGGATADNPVPLMVTIPLGIMTQAGSGWQNLLAVIAAAGKYVALDLSACTMDGTEFNPDNSISTGKDKIVSLDLPDGADSIAAGDGGGTDYSGTGYITSSFRYFSSLTAVTAQNVLTIGGAAFFTCTSLATITFSRLETIGGYCAFSGCTSLTGITFPSSVTYIGSDAFSGCTSLTSVTFAAGSRLETIDHGAFAGCTSLASVTLPITLQYVDWLAFGDCPNLASISVDENNPYFTSQGGILYDKEITALIAVPGKINGALIIPDTVRGISAYAFEGCASLTSVTLGANVEGLSNVGGVHRFRGCTSLTSILVHENNPYFSSQDGVLYNKAKTRIEVYPQGISGAFTIPASVTAIGDSTFNGCSSLTGLTIPEGVTSIEMRAFWDCSNITSITIPASVTSIGQSVFANWKSTQTIYVQGHANEASADAAWGGADWRGGSCYANIVYQGQ